MSPLSINPTFVEKDPCKEIRAALDALMLEALIISAIASACARSILLLRKALSVNSPGFECCIFLTYNAQNMV